MPREPEWHDQTRSSFAARAIGPRRHGLWNARPDRSAGRRRSNRRGVYGSRGGGCTRLDESDGAPKPSLPGQGQAGRPPVHERRAVARRHLRSQADADEISRQAAARPESPHRAQDRRGPGLAVLVSRSTARAASRSASCSRDGRAGTSTTCASSARCTPTCPTTSRR